jgi:hypothetical protein
LYKSHLTQELANYYDEKDTRVRKNSVCLDAQLLNAVAMQLDDTNQRVGRERAAFFLRTTPIHIDNRGIYYGIPLPNDFQVPDDLTKLQVVADGVTLTLFDDRLPVPKSVVPDGAPVALTSPVIMDATGSGDSVAQIWDVQTQSFSTSLPVPNKLAFWVEGIGIRPSSISVLIQGEKYPRPAWVNQRKKVSESVSIGAQGLTVTKFAWELIDKITVSGLPGGARLRCWSIGFGIPADLDDGRPFVHPTFRDVVFDRYWQISTEDGQIEEVYNPGNYTDLEHIESYVTPILFTDLAVEPQTWGIWGVTGSSLVYWDRRPAMPDHLDQAALTAEPLFGLTVEYDPVSSGQTTYLNIAPEPYSASASVFQSRYLLTDPQNNIFALLLDGSLVSYSGGAGWQRGAPQKLKIPLAQTGTYVITLECMDSNGVLTSDSFPYANYALAPLSTIPTTQLSPQVKGVAFDALERLWIWDGDFAVPVKPLYKAFVYDEDTRTVYLTESAASVTITNVS